MPTVARRDVDVSGQGRGQSSVVEPLRDDHLLERPVRFDRDRIASLSTVDIYDLTCEALVDVVRGADVPFLPSDVQGRLEFQDRCVLERLAFLARECCRNRRPADAPAGRIGRCR